MIKPVWLVLVAFSAVSSPLFSMGRSESHEIGESIHQASFSRDGKKLLLGLKDNLFEMNLDTGVVVPIGEKGLYSPSYSSGRNFIASCFLNPDDRRALLQNQQTFGYDLARIPEIFSGIEILQYGKAIARFETDGYCRFPYFDEGTGKVYYVRINAPKSLLDKSHSWDFYQNSVDGKSELRITTAYARNIWDINWDVSGMAAYCIMPDDSGSIENSVRHVNLSNGTIQDVAVDKMTSIGSFTYGKVSIGMDYSSGKLFAMAEPDHRFGYRDARVFSEDSVQGELGRLSFRVSDDTFNRFVGLTVSASMGRIAFFLRSIGSPSGGKPQQRLYICNLDGSDLRQVQFDLRSSVFSLVGRE